jgi:hypothetical protein
MIFCFGYTISQSTGCTESGTYILLHQRELAKSNTAWMEAVQAENALLKTKMQLLEMRGVDTDNYDIPADLNKK